MPITKEKRADINRRNAQKSTGPKTQEGKDRVRLNARHARAVVALPVTLRFEEPQVVQRMLRELKG